MPPLRMHVKGLVGFTRHPFYRRNEVQAFVAERNGVPCGRIAAIVNHDHMERYHDRRGFFGFFESIDDVEVATALFDAAKDWHARRNIQDIRGPVNPSMNYECGLLIDGFDTPPFFMMTHNPSYYGRLVESCGFRKAHDMYAFWGHTNMVTTLDKKLAFVAEEGMRRMNIRLRTLDPRRFPQEVDTFLEIYNRSMDGAWGFTPLSPAEIDELGGSLRMLIVPGLTSLAEVEGRVIGAAFALLDYNPRIRAIGGRLFPFGFLRLLWNKKKLKRIRFMSANVVPEYQKWGVGLMLLHHLLHPILDWGIEEVEFSWVLESNRLSLGTLKRGGARISKTYRMYDFGPTPDPQQFLAERTRWTNR